MKVFEIQHPGNSRALVPVNNIESVSQITEVENVEYAGDLFEKTVKSFNINMKSSSNHVIKSYDKIFSLSDSHVTGKWEISRHEISFDDFYTEIAVALIQQN